MRSSGYCNLLCAGGCNPMHLRVQPFVTRAATHALWLQPRVAPGCNPSHLRRQPKSHPPPACGPDHPRLRRRSAQAAAPVAPGCNPMCHRLQPYVSQTFASGVPRIAPLRRDVTESPAPGAYSPPLGVRRGAESGAPPWPGEGGKCGECGKGGTGGTGGEGGKGGECGECSKGGTGGTGGKGGTSPLPMRLFSTSHGH